MKIEETIFFVYILVKEIGKIKIKIIGLNKT